MKLKKFMVAGDDIVVDVSASNSEQFGASLRLHVLLKKGLKSVRSGGTVKIKPGTYNESLLSITQNVKLRSKGGTVRIR